MRLGVGVHPHIPQVSPWPSHRERGWSWEGWLEERQGQHYLGPGPPARPTGIIPSTSFLQSEASGPAIWIPSWA
jgi:hypothetical protein